MLIRGSSDPARLHDSPWPGSPRPVAALLAAGLLGLGACSGDSPSDPLCEADSVTITGLAEVIHALEDVQLSAQVVGANCASAAVDWSVSDGLEIDGQGRVRGLLLGGPFTVTAEAGGATGTAQTTVAAADVVADTRWGLAWNNDQAGANPTLNNIYLFSSSGGAITSTRSGNGAYRVVFAGLAAQAGQRQAVHVSAYYSGIGAPRRCRVLSTESAGANLAAEVRCHDFSGTLADARFDILVAPAGSTTGRSAFVVSTSADGGEVPASMAHSSAQGAIRVERLELGGYTVIFEGLARAAVTGSAPETFHVTAYGDGTGWCKIQSWGNVGTDDLGVTVRCFSAAGAPADARFAVLMLERERTGKRLGFAWANQQSSLVEYAPSATYSYNSAGQINLAVQSSTGVYLATWPGLARIAGSTAAPHLVTAYRQPMPPTARWATGGTSESRFAASRRMARRRTRGSPRPGSNRTSG
jgi:hypothetical protein